MEDSKRGAGPAGEKQHGTAMLLNVSLTNTNNHGEKQAKASKHVVRINQCESDA